MKMPLRRQAVDEAAALNSTKTEKTLTREAQLSAPRQPHGSTMDPQRSVLEGKKRLNLSNRLILTRFITFSD